jgi:hypothetical protein
MEDKGKHITISSGRHTVGTVREADNRAYTIVREPYASLRFARGALPRASPDYRLDRLPPPVVAELNRDLALAGGAEQAGHVDRKGVRGVTWRERAPRLPSASEKSPAARTWEVDPLGLLSRQPEDLLSSEAMSESNAERMM